MAYDLEFEQPLAVLEEEILALHLKGACLNDSEHAYLQKAKDKLRQRTEEIYYNLTSWQTVQVARHKDRPYAQDYLRLICDDFFELHGDRCFGDDQAIVAGLAILDGNTVMFICHQKGRDTKTKQLHNFGMPHPEGYRKAHRLMKEAEKFGIPVICLIDTPGAYPGLEDEERGQSAAIASNLYLMSRLRVPILAAVIGEGGSGGALAIGVVDCLLMLEYSIYTVVTPEAAASILWRDSTLAFKAAKAMRISAHEIQAMQLVDELVSEPLGGAHRDHRQAAQNLKLALLKHLTELQQMSPGELLEKRYRKFRNIGEFDRIRQSV